MSGLIWAPGRVQPGTVKHGMMSYMDVWPTTTAMAGLKVSSNGEYAGNDGKPIFFDGIDNSGYATGKAKELARTEMIVAVSYGLHGSKITKIER